MNSRRRLSSEEAALLGLDVRSYSNGEKVKYTVSPEEWRKILTFRNNGIKVIADRQEVDPAVLKHLWIKDGNASTFIKNPLYVSPVEKQYFDLRDEIIRDLQKFKPKFKKIKRSQGNDPHLLVIDPADLHLGKLAKAFQAGDEYNNNIAIQRAKEGVQGILDKASGFNIDKILFIGGNDVLHVDTPSNTTTGGTKQDVDGMWYSNYLLAKQLYVDLLMTLISVADVHFCFNPSNHDYTNGFFLADVIQTYFKDCKNITFDCDLQHRKYFKYYDNLIGTTHGDGAKVSLLPSLMAHEAEDWSSTPNRYIYTHHVHHKNSKDYVGVTIESVRSASGTDAWHNIKGFTGAIKAVEGFLHHREFGQVARITHKFL